MPNTHATLTSLFTDIANAIRTKKGTSASIVADNFPSEILSIPGGGSTGGISTATATPASASSSIQFTSLRGEPTSFVVVATAALATGASPYKTAAVVYDGTNIFGQYITNTNNAQMTYSASAFAKSYSNGTLIITGTDTNFQNIQYKLIYSYGQTAETATATVGSGVTSITFTGLTGEPTYFSCIFKGDNIGTSSGYTRTHVVAYDGDAVIGLRMGSNSAPPNTTWTANYNNGSLTITSSGTNDGGYFHQSTNGYYQLTYAVDGGGINTKTITQNGTYNAEDDGIDGWQRVVVNVPASAGMNVQAYHGMASVNTTSLSASGVKVTVAKSGTYKVSWMGARSNNSGTWQTRLYIGGSAYGTAQTTFTNTYGQSVTLTGVSLTQGQTVEVYARARGTSYYMMVGNLVIEQTA